MEICTVCFFFTNTTFSTIQLLSLKAQNVMKTTQKYDTKDNKMRNYDISQPTFFGAMHGKPWQGSFA